MSYKSLLTVLTDPNLAPGLLGQATELAARLDAHLDVLCIGVDRTQTGYYYAGASALVLQETITRASREAEELEAFARKELGKTDIRWGCDHTVAPIADLGRHVAGHARYSDLVVLPQPYGEERGAELESVVEGALFEGRTPVLVMPEGASLATLPSRIALAWNESAEALVAVRAALPFIAGAERVNVVVIDPPTHGPNRSDPGGLLSQYITRHGARVEVDVLAKSLPRVSDVLLRHATDTDTQMIVMGAYGHSRFREAILGGATRNMLEQSKLPVFMAH
ncbi:universal stress protein [Primorskyibacter aestuariivivens]|uniref:universal stress protein n=1 Tax=Primorskyibacter aestuariivivens TaxID=1888912 RepID=UPI002300809E|nr:universal stress protein [Primorskyibacter aestuariivivens]MDA7427374.1 universal stress protein [Primorskyibacter aestuariivivens]